MRSNKLLSKYEHGDLAVPQHGYERLLYLAAQLVRMAKEERRTWRERRAKAPANEGPTLFDYARENVK